MLRERLEGGPLKKCESQKGEKWKNEGKCNGSASAAWRVAFPGEERCGERNGTDWNGFGTERNGNGTDATPRGGRTKGLGNGKELEREREKSFLFLGKGREGGRGRERVCAKLKEKGEGGREGFGPVRLQTLLNSDWRYYC